MIRETPERFGDLDHMFSNSGCFFISLIAGRKIDKRDAYWIVYGLVTIDVLCSVAKMDQILT